MEGKAGSVPFVVNREAVAKGLALTENINGRRGWRIPGLLSAWGVPNGNNREYGRSVWEKQVAAGSRLQQLIEAGDSLGLLEHPADGLVDYNKPISHMVTAVKLNEKDHTVEGEIILFDTQAGRDIKAMIEGGHNPKVSSRGFGSLVKNEAGLDIVQDDYICEGWDIVVRPSFANAVLSPTIDTILGKNNESTPTPAAPAQITQIKETTLGTDPVSAPPAAPAAATAPAAPVVAPKAQTHMNISEVRSRVASLKAVRPTSPQQFSEAVAQANDAHTVIEAFIQEDTKANSYQGSKLHRELESVEATWAQLQQAPAKNVLKLKEDYTKVLHVTKKIVEAATQYKKALAESLKREAAQAKMIEALAKKAKGWYQIAESRKDSARIVGLRYDKACQCVDETLERFEETAAALGGRLIETELGTKITPEITKAIKEAKGHKDILAIRSKLSESKTPATAPAAPATGTTPAAPAAPVTESTTPAAPANPAAPQAPVFTAKIVENAVYSGGVDDTASMIRRLSESR